MNISQEVTIDNITYRMVDGYPLYRGQFTIGIGSGHYYTVDGAGDTPEQAKQDVLRQIKEMAARLQVFIARNSKLTLIENTNGHPHSD